MQPSRRLTGREKAPPLGRSQFPRALLPGQPSGSRRWHPCCRRCLLKGCECWFLPRWPQARYCKACQEAARYWRVWYANQRYRASDQGKERRRDQNRRYRECRRQRPPPADTPPPTPHLEPASPVMDAETFPRIVPHLEPASPVIEAETHPRIAAHLKPASPVIEAETHPRIAAHLEPASPMIEAETHPRIVPPPVIPPAGEGQRPTEIPRKSCGLPCSRPGCYVLFLPSVRGPDQKFCSDSCRKALRRVRQREARLRHRRRRGARPLRPPHRGPPHTNAFMSSHS